MNYISPFINKGVMYTILAEAQVSLQPLRMPEEYLTTWIECFQTFVYRQTTDILKENNSSLNEIAKNLFLTFY